MALSNAEKQSAYRLRKARRRAVDAGDVSRVMQIDRKLSGDVAPEVRLMRAARFVPSAETLWRAELEAAANERIEAERAIQMAKPVAEMDLEAVGRVRLAVLDIVRLASKLDRLA